MPQPAEFRNTLDLLSEYVHDIGDEVEEEFVEDLLAIEIRGEEKWLTGHRCRQENNVYVVAGHEDLRSMGVVYFLSIVDNIARQLDSESAEAIVSAAEENTEESLEEHERARLAAEILLQKVDPADMGALENYVYMMVSGGDHETQLYNDEWGLRGFNTARLFFPFERSFGIKEFYESVQAAVQAGKRGNKLMGRTIFVDMNDSDPSDAELRLNFGW